MGENDLFEKFVLHCVSFPVESKRDGEREMRNGKEVSYFVHVASQMKMLEVK